VVDTCSITVSGVAGVGSASCALATPYRMVTSTAAADVSGNADAVVSAKSSSAQGNQQNAATGVIMTIVF
jgi:hypothetical protein